MESADKSVPTCSSFWCFTFFYLTEDVKETVAVSYSLDNDREISRTFRGEILLDCPIGDFIFAICDSRRPFSESSFLHIVVVVCKTVYGQLKIYFPYYNGKLAIPT